MNNAKANYEHKDKKKYDNGKLKQFSKSPESFLSPVIIGFETDIKFES